jgi:glycosyltransferase involved in cell wall biosynthesis
MRKADLHVHSKYSDHPSEWFLQRLGASESYTEPDYIYNTMKEREMDFVTITDHNKIDGVLYLKEKYPHDVFMGVESTAYFPEDDCKIHVLIYGFDEKQFIEIQKYRRNIYELREYLKMENLAHSIAHATFSINGKLTLTHLEKLILLFDVFEGINGARCKVNNNTWSNILSYLTPEIIEELYKKYRITPFSKNSWIKGFTGGSDDHAGLFLGQTYTIADAQSLYGFLTHIKNKQTYPEGRHNNYKSLAFTIYKIANDFSKHKKEKITSSSFLSQLPEFIFERKDTGLKNKISLKRLKSLSKKNGNKIYDLILEFVDVLSNNKNMSLEDKLDITYSKIAEIADEFFKQLLKSLEKDIKNIDITNIIKNISASLMGIFLSVPFFSTLKVLRESRNLINDLVVKYGNGHFEDQKRILWFTDTISDLNGVSTTLRKIGHLAYEKNLNINLITSLQPEEIIDELPKNLINLPNIYSFPLPGYEKYIMNVPSVLKSLELIYQYDPDIIFISTPGPLGLLGLLSAYVLNIKSVGIYHSDYALQAHKIMKDEYIAHIVESYIKSFYSSMDEIRVPTKEYISILENRGIAPAKMKPFRRGVDVELFSPKPFSRSHFQTKYNIKDGFNLIYAGRISQDKELDFLVEVYRALIKKRDDINLIIAGDGPYLKEMKAKTKAFERIVFTNQIEHSTTPELYSSADLLVFPSTTDTFGMVVLEAQACGVPAVVSSIGGPKDIIVDYKTGLIAHAYVLHDWVDKIEFLMKMTETNAARYAKMKDESRQNVLRYYDWNKVIYEIVNDTKIKRPNKKYFMPSLIPANK